MSEMFMERLSEEVGHVVSLLNMSGPEHRYRLELIKKTKSLIKGSLPGCTVEVYGSWATKLALPSSDIDFVVLGCSQHPKESMLRQVVAAFEHTGLQCTAVLPTARVPVVKFLCPASGLRGDITFNIDNWQTSVSLVKNLLEEYADYYARELIILFKFILVLTSNNEVCKGGLSSYGLCLMVFAYLRRFKEEGKTPSLGLLLHGFLVHYRDNGSFNPTAMTVDIEKPEGYRMGLMRPMSSRHIKGSWCVQDPLSSSNNVTEQCFSIKKISDIFTNMAGVLDKVMGRQNLPRGAGGQDCVILREAICDLHHFQRQRRELLELWMKQEVYQMQVQAMAMYKGYAQWGPAGFPVQYPPHPHHHMHHLFHHFPRGVSPHMAQPYQGKVYHASVPLRGTPISAPYATPFEHYAQNLHTPTRGNDSSDEGSTDSIGNTESNSNSSGSVTNTSSIPSVGVTSRKKNARPAPPQKPKQHREQH
eukprot:TRINITY_DN12774_c0_g1_i1.p1 TRINITY_DN12774_c0_g1~~TRINITY_DN12774_c0_g1_i1.p1  ORF type:complete len:488 (+),score=20.34 TRINITY_DN12774_c0_g1_i1:40-1464(+)